MIIVGMGDKDEMQTFNVFRFERKVDNPPEDFDSAGEIGIGQDGRAGKIDKDGGVPHPAGNDFLPLGISRKRHFQS